jgi:TatA/E family protein of Tat protein translocase
LKPVGEAAMLSIPHLIIIFVVALVVFGPEKLPELARNLGKVLGEFRRATGDLRSTFEDHLRDLERETEQRRIGGATSAPSARGASQTPVTPAVTPAEGTVPTMPPQSAVGTPALYEVTPAEENPLQEDSADPGSAKNSASEPASGAPTHSGLSSIDTNIHTNREKAN